MKPSSYRARRCDAVIRRSSLWLLLTLSVLALQGCFGSGASQSPIQLAEQVDLNRMYGGWYIVATIPNRFEKGLVAPFDVYSPRADGDIKEDFYVRDGGFSAPVKHFTVHDWAVPGTHNARWRVQIFWPIDLPFLVLYVDPDYRYVLFGEENRSLGWIYARDPNLDDATYTSLLEQFRLRGYDISQFRRWVQNPGQIGQPGFWSDGIAR